jgi:hypothetical protein
LKKTSAILLLTAEKRSYGEKSMCNFFMFDFATAIDDRCYHDNVTGGTSTIYLLKVVGGCVFS